MDDSTPRDNLHAAGPGGWGSGDEYYQQQPQQPLHSPNAASPRSRSDQSQSRSPLEHSQKGAAAVGGCHDNDDVDDVIRKFNIDVNDVHNVDPKAVEKLTSAELKSLSPDQREQILEELHGVSSPHRIETPQLIDESLRQMESELQNLVPDGRPTKQNAYLCAKSLNSHFVTQTNVRLKFLRSEFFDVQKATVRFLNWLEVLLEYFGATALMRPITLDDLDDDEIVLMKKGEIQVLPDRDHPFGRRVVAVFGVDAKSVKYTTRQRTRTCIYMISVISEDVDTQVRGIVWVYFERSDWRITCPGRWSDSARLAKSIPVRTSAVHLCLPNGNHVLSMAMSALMVQIGKFSRIRSRIHEGSVTEISYKLMAFTVPVDSLPIRSSGDVKTKNHLQWMESRLALEHAMQQAEQNQTPFDDDVVECPRLPDVVFKVGERGTRPGNVKLRELVESRHERYQTKTSRSVKNEVIQEIVKGIEDVGGRFLVWDSRGWYVVLSDPAIIKKQISTYIRDYKNRRSNKRRSDSSLQSFESGTTKFLSNGSSSPENAGSYSPKRSCSETSGSCFGF